MLWFLIKKTPGSAHSGLY